MYECTVSGEKKFFKYIFNEAQKKLNKQYRDSKKFALCCYLFHTNDGLGKITNYIS